MAEKYRVTYVEDDGKAHTVEVAEGWSLMEGAVKHLIPGIDMRQRVAGQAIGLTAAGFEDLAHMAQIRSVLRNRRRGEEDLQQHRHQRGNAVLARQPAAHAAPERRA